jgi:hypothetical protein
VDLDADVAGAEGLIDGDVAQGDTAPLFKYQRFHGTLPSTLPGGHDHT